MSDSPAVEWAHYKGVWAGACILLAISSGVFLANSPAVMVY